MHVPHNLSDHSGPLSQTIPIFCKRTSKLSCPTVGLSKFVETDFHVSRQSRYVTFKEALQQRQNSFTCSAFFCVYKCFWSFFPTWHYRLVVNNHALKSRFAFCLHIFAGYYIRRVCINLLHCILHLIDNTINSDGHRLWHIRIFID
jgi:hypothetical protein